MKAMFLIFFLTAAACGDGLDPACNKASIEADLSATPWTGPAALGGVVQAPAPGTQYLISTTYLRMTVGEATKKAFTSVLGPITTDIQTRDGLLAYQFASSAHCNTARTLTVWRDAAAMYAFVGGDAHGAAINAIATISRGASEATHFAGSEQDATWQTAARNLQLSSGRKF